MKRVLQAGAIAVVAALLGLFAWQLAHRPGDGFVSAVARGERPAAPAFSLPTLDGTRTVSLASLRGRPAVINFWASWCVPCGIEARQLNDLASSWRARGVRFVGIDAQDARDAAQTFARRNRVGYTLVHDAEGNVKTRYGVSQMPETFVLDAEGRTVAHYAGAIVPDGETGVATVSDVAAALRRTVAS